MKQGPASPPYFDRILQQLAVSDPNVDAAFGHHVHWGYWEEPSEGIPTAAEYGHAAEALCMKLLKLADIRDDSEILDVGCGFGGTLSCLNNLYTHLRLVGLNIDLQQLQRAASRIELRAENSIELILADAAQLPLADQSIDVALAVESVFHFDRARFFREIGRVLRRGGSLTFSDFVLHERAVPYVDSVDLSGNDAVVATYGSIDLSWSVERYRRLGEECGLNLTAVSDVTANTLPTYEFLRSSVSGWANKEHVQAFLIATGLLEKASRKGIVTYQILRMERSMASRC